MSMSTSETSTASGSPFWRFSLGYYRQPGVGDACILLQDTCGIDVNLLLFLLWLAASKRRLGFDDVRMIDAMVHEWRERVVISLRNLRRQLKGNTPLIAAGPAEAFRSKIKAVELEAERLQQEALYDFANSMTLGELQGSLEDAARANIAAYENVVGQKFPPMPVGILLGALRTAGEARAPRRER
jgi:uncharacterized protein (TIGR02444 family)